MSESKFTPGPWRMNGPTGPTMQSYSQPFCIAGTGEFAYTLIAGCFGDIKGGTEIAEANARLIAAAPDLLEALEHIVNAVAICTDDHGNLTAEICQADDFRAARAAIAKATGAA